MTEPMELVYVVYGLAFIFVGAAIVLQPHTDAGKELTRFLPLLAGFGFTHGLHEWCGIVQQLYPELNQRHLLELALLVASFLLLYEFGRRLLRSTTRPDNRFYVLTDPRVYLLLLVSLFAAAAAFGLPGFKAAARYLLALPAALTTAAGLIAYCRSAGRGLSRLKITLWLRIAAFGFTAYGLLGGLVTTPAGFFPADRVNSEMFLELTGIHVELIRAAAAVLIAFAIARILRLFHGASQQALSSALARATHAISALSGMTQRHEQILRIVGSGIVGLDRHGVCVFANPAALRILGYSHNQLVGANFFHLLLCACADEQPGHCPVQAVLKTRTAVHRREDRFTRRDGGQIAVEYVSEPVNEEGELKGGAVIAFTDITQHKEAERQLLQMTRMLQEKTTHLQRANAELEQYAYVAAHDLKSPARAVSMLACVIESDLAEGATDNVVNNARLLRRRAERMNRFIDALLAYSQAGQGHEVLEKVDTAELVREVVATLDVPSSFTIEVTGQMPSLLTRRIPLQQVFSNLVANAIEHHDRGAGRIALHAAEKEGCVEFEIRDDGPGIPAEYRDRVLRVFQLLHPRDRVDRTGLGLALVRKLVEQHGGRLQLDGGPDRGTVVRFTWPDGGTATATEPQRSRLGGTEDCSSCA